MASALFRGRNLVVGIAILALVAGTLPSRGATPPSDAEHALAGPGASRFPSNLTPDQSDAPIVDPFPIRRVFLPANRVGATIAQAGPRGMVRLPRPEFEEKVRQASRTQDLVANPPRLAEATYRARLEPGGLVGSATWRIVNTANAGGVLPLDTLRVAVQDPRWSDGRAAILFRGLTEKSSTALLVDRPSDTMMSLGWSCRSTEEPAAERFDVGIPPSPLAMLELDLPHDREPVLPQPGPLVSGPYPGPGNRKIWRISVGGVSRLDLTIRRAGGEGEPPPAVRVARSTRHDVAPGEVVSTFNFDVESVRGSIADLSIHTDAGMRLRDVTGSTPLTWRSEGQKGKSPHTVKVSFRDPIATGRVTLTCTSPLPSPPPGGWTCPRARVEGGLPSGDAIDVRIDPDLRYLGCDPGDFRVAEVGDDERGYRVGYTGTFPRSTVTDRRAPTLRLVSGGPLFSTTENWRWSLTPDGITLSSAVRIRVGRGPLSQIAFQVPPEYSAESVTLVPDDPGATLLPGGNGTVVLEPSRPVPTGGEIEATLKMRSSRRFAGFDPASGSPASTILPFPQFSPLGAAQRDGTLVVSVHPGLTVSFSPAVPKSGTYAFSGRGPDGVLAIGPRPAGVGVVSDTVLSLTGNSATWTSTLKIRSDGDVDSLTVFTPFRQDLIWEVTPPPGSSVNQVPGWPVLPWCGSLGATVPWSAVVSGTMANQTRGSLWRVVFSRRLKGETSLSVIGKQPLKSSDGLIVPLPSILGCESTRSSVSLHSSAVNRFDPPLPVEPTTFPAIATLAPRGTSSTAGDPGDRTWKMDSVSILSRVEASGNLLCTLTGRVREAGARALPVGLPGGAELVEVRVAGRFAQPVSTHAESREVHISIPFPRVPAEGTTFAVQYRLPVAVGLGLVEYQSPGPELPMAQIPIRRKWSVSPEFQLVAFPGTRDRDDLDSIVVVPRSTLAGTGGILGVLVLALGLVGGIRRSRMAVLGVVLAVALGGLASWVLPGDWHVLCGPPLLVGLFLLGVVAAPARPRDRDGNQTATSSETPASRRDVWPRRTSTGITLAVLFCTSSLAQAPEPVVVYLTPRPGSETELDVLVPQGVLDRLGNLCHPPVLGPVLTSAEYQGSADQGTADGAAFFEGKIHVWVPEAGDHKLLIPFSKVRFESVQIDGKPAFPTAEPGERYGVTVSGKGEHMIRIRFAVPVVATGTDRDIRFSVPDLPSSRITFTAPAESTAPDISSRRGSQRVVDQGGRSRVEADHGGGKEVVVRWRAGSAAGSSANVTVREACIWDLREAGVSAVSAFLFRTNGGTVTRLRFDIPDDLEPAKVVVRPGDTQTTGVGLKEWKVGGAKNGWQPVELGLQGPVEGSVLVVVRLYPKKSVPFRPVLRIPHVREAADVSAYLAIRLAGLNLDNLGRAGVVDYPVDGFTKEFGFVPELVLDRFPPSRVFRRDGNSQPELRPQLSPTPPTQTSTARVNWVVGSRAEAEGDISVAPRETPISFLEFDILGPLQVSELRSSSLASWSQAGNRVQVWLRRPTSNPVEIRLVGTLNGYQRSGRAGSEPGPVDLPLCRVVGADPGPVEFRVRPAPGWGIALQQVPGVRQAGAERYIAEASVGSGVKFLATPPNPPSRVDSVISLDRSGGKILYRVGLVLPSRGSRPTGFAIQFPGVPRGSKPELRGSAGSHIAAAQPSPGGWNWLVTSSVPETTPLVLTLTGEVPVTEELVLPDPVLWFGSYPVRPTLLSLVVDDEIRPTVPLDWVRGDPNELGKIRTKVSSSFDFPAGGSVWLPCDESPSVRVGLTPGLGAKPLAPSPGKPGATLAPEGVVEPGSGRSSGFPILASAVWLAGLFVVTCLTAWGHAGWWPERLAGCGLLGLVFVSVWTPIGVIFALMALVGWAFRFTWSIGRFARVVSR